MVVFPEQFRLKTWRGEIELHTERVFQRSSSFIRDSHIFVKLKRVIGACGTVLIKAGSEVVTGAAPDNLSSLANTVWLPDGRNIPPPMRDGFAVSRNCFASLKPSVFAEVICFGRGGIVL